MNIPLLFGRYLVRRGKIKESDLTDVLSVQKEINMPLSVFALENGFISLEDFKKILRLQKEKALRFKDAAAELQILDEESIEEISQKQKASITPIGSLLIKRGLITSEELDSELKTMQEELPSKP